MATVCSQLLCNTEQTRSNCSVVRRDHGEGEEPNLRQTVELPVIHLYIPVKPVAPEWSPVQQDPF